MTDCLWMLNDNLMQCAKQKRISKQFAKLFYGSSKIFHCLNPLFSGIYKIFLQTIISRPFEICEPNQEQCMVWGVTAIRAVQCSGGILCNERKSLWIQKFAHLFIKFLKILKLKCIII